MKDAPAIMTNQEEAVEKSECNGVDCEQVHCCNNFAVVLEKRFPPSDLVGVPWCPLYPARNGALRNVEAEHLQFPVNAGRTPRRLFLNHLEDEIAQLLANAFSSRGNWMVVEPSPIETETSTVPAGNGLCTHEDQGLFPSRPVLSNKDPEELIERSQTRP